MALNRSNYSLYWLSFMKTIIPAVIFLGVAFVLPVYGSSKKPLRRALFVAMLDDRTVFSSRTDIKRLVDSSEQSGINILYVQVYRANKSWFPSKVVDSAPYVRCFKDVSADPFETLIKLAHLKGIKVYAWLNILSLSKNIEAPLIKKYGASILTCNIKDKQKLQDYEIDDQYFLEPGDLRVRAELVKVVEEVLRAYPELDGLQFDYMRYPDKNPSYGFTRLNVERFKKATGARVINENSLEWKDWKRTQVNEFLINLVERARAIKPKIIISATGCMPYQRAYYEAFQDWPLWLRRGIVDQITLMNYSPDPIEFSRWLNFAKSVVGDITDINVGIGAYKLVDSPGIFAEELRICEDSGCGGCAIFYYDSLLKNPLLRKSLGDN